MHKALIGCILDIKIIPDQTSCDLDIIFLELF